MYRGDAVKMCGIQQEGVPDIYESQLRSSLERASHIAYETTSLQETEGPALAFESGYQVSYGWSVEIHISYWILENKGLEADYRADRY